MTFPQVRGQQERTLTLTFNNRPLSRSSGLRCSRPSRGLEGQRLDAAGPHPRTVLRPVLFPVVSRVAEHQQVGGQPVGAAVATLRGHRRDLGAPAQVHLQPLVAV